MAVNRDNTITNRHKAFIGASGSGKTTGIKQDPDVVNADILIAYDPMGDHDVIHYQTFPAFHDAVLTRLKNGQRIRCGYNPTSNKKEELEKVSKLVWEISDGRLPIVCLMEELSTCLKSSGALDGKAGELFSAGRSYNVQLILSAQRTATIPKDITGNCANTYFFAQHNIVDAQGTGQMASRKPEEILQLKLGEYFHFQAGRPGTELKRTRKP